MAKDSKGLGIEELTLYDALIKHYLKLSTGGDNFATNEQIDELFSSKVKPFDTATDEEFVAIINGYYNGTISLEEIQEVWSIGDTREIEMYGISDHDTTYIDEGIGWEVGESHSGGPYTIQILGFLHDELATPINGKTMALITVDFKDCFKPESLDDTDGNNNPENGYMNSTNTNIGGWQDCARRGWCNYGVYISLPQYLTQNNLIKGVKKVTSAGNLSSDMITTTDWVFLLSEIEIFGTTEYSFIGEGEQYNLYAQGGWKFVKLPNNSFAPSGNKYWTRSPSKFNAAPTPLDGTWLEFCAVNGTQISTFPPRSTLGLAPAFCL